MTLKPEKQAELLACWREGLSLPATRRLTGVSANAVVRYFMLFGWKYGRRPRQCRASPQPRRPQGLPKYDGPVWIGKQITPPTPPIGPDWIGKAIPAARLK